MSSCDKEGMMISKSLEFPMKSEIEDPLSPSAVNPENSGLFCDVGLLNEESLIIDPDLEIKTEPEIIESSEGDMKCSYDYDVSVSEDNLQSCKNEVNEEEENVKTYSRTGVKEEYGIEFETCEKEDEGKGSENSGFEKSLCQARDSKTHHKTHREEKSYKCMECGKEYNYKYLLIIHYRDHTGEKPFKCDACGKRYNHKSLLMIHYRIHTGEKPFKCNICGKAFIQKNHLTAHHRSHNGEKAFKCNVCDTTFTEKSNLTRHYRIHTKPFKCNSCDKAFTEKSGLTAHQRIHTGRQ